MSRTIPLFVSLLLVFFIVACTEQTPEQVESQKAAESQPVKASEPLPVKDVKAFKIQDVKAWKGFKGNTVESGKDGGVLLTSSLDAPKSRSTTQGVYVMIPIHQAIEQSGKTVQVTIEAAKAIENSASEFAIAFSTAEVGNSGWKKFTPTEKFTSFAFEYKVPKCKKCNANFIGVWADTQGTGKGLLVKSVSVKILH